MINVNNPEKNTSKNLPSLSVVVPVFNSQHYIEATINSLIRIGKNIDLEVIFQDALSTDGTSETIRKYIENNKNFFHHREKDLGQSDAINKGVEKSNGQWVTWLCADDLLLDNFENFFLGAANNNDVDVFYGDCIFLQNNSSIPAIGTEQYKEGKLAKKRLFIQQPGTCIRKEKWEKVGGLDLDLNWIMDYELFLRLEDAGYKFRKYDYFISVARIHDDAKTSSGSFLRFLEYFRVFSRVHRKKIRNSSLRPYVIYFIEYLIKKIESGRKGNKISKSLHVIFWMIARPEEERSIRKRFSKECISLEENINILEKTTIK